MTSIVPRPQSIEMREGTFPVGSIVRVGSGAGPVAMNIAAHFCEYLSERVGQAVNCQVTDDRQTAAIKLVAGNDLADEAYRIAIGPEIIDIVASHPAGWFYGLQTLSLLLRNTLLGGRREMPCQLINDAPRFNWRGMHLDVCRHFFDVAFIKRLLDLMALHKFNRFHWHLTEDQGWRIDIPGRPRLAEISAWREENGAQYGGFYTHAEIREVVQYAADRFIQVVPEIELPGHSVAALAAYPELACQPRSFTVETEWGIFDDVYCAGNDATFEFLEEVMEVTLGLFPSDVVHIGGDECPRTRWRACPKCQARIAAEHLQDEDALQSWFVGKMVSLLAERGRKAIGWDEILAGGLAPGAMVMSWRGATGGVAAARMGHDVVMSPTTHCYFDYRQEDDESEPGFHGVNTLQDVYDFHPIPVELTASEAQHILGGQGNIWTERMVTPADVEFMIIPRMCALAEVVWTHDSRDWPDFRRRLEPHMQLLSELGYRGRPPDQEDA